MVENPAQASHVSFVVGVSDETVLVSVDHGRIALRTALRIGVDVGVTVTVAVGLVVKESDAEREGDRDGDVDGDNVAASSFTCNKARHAANIHVQVGFIFSIQLS
jgi:hypothetical protein